MRRKKYIKGTIGALIGGLVGAIPWIIVEVTTSFFIGWLGFLIGISALYGYRKMGGLENKNARWILLGATFISVVFAEICANMIYLYQDGYAMNLFNLQLLFSIPEFVNQFLINIAIGMLIAFFGIKSIFDSFN